MNIGIIGLGLIGGSLGRVIVKSGNHKVFATDISAEAMRVGKLLQAYNEELTVQNAKQIDVLFLALYPNYLEEAMNKYCPFLKKGCIVADCCGNKKRIVNDMQKLSKVYPDLEFISTHPMAGREFSGVSHSTANLFDKASMIFVPVHADIKTIASFKAFCLEIGFGNVVITTAEKHDEIIAFTSQLAHIVSSSYIKSDSATSFMGFSAGSFRDMTRVARLSPEMWSSLMMDNRENLIKEIEQLTKHLTEYKDALSDADTERLKELLQDGNEKKLESEKMRRIWNNEK